MTTIRILFLSDFHQNMSGQKTLWPNVQTKFLDDLELLSATKIPWDLVIFTGDLTQTGSPKEFSAFGDTLDKIWERLRKLGSMPDLVAIPGNHDLVRPDPTAGATRALAHWTDDAILRTHFWESKSDECRLLVNRMFTPFLEWRRKEKRHVKVHDGCLPGDISASLSRGDTRIGIVGLNSAFLQLDSGPHEGRLAVSYQQLQGVCGDHPAEWAARHDISLLLTHHPTSWLHTPSREEFSREIFDPSHFPIHLFGHMHDPQQRSIAVSGAPPRHELQAASLFGLETWVDHLGASNTRSHGYSDITIHFDADVTRLNVRPRRLEHTDHRLPMRMVADTRHFMLTNDAYEITIPRRRTSSVPRIASAGAATRRCEPEGLLILGGLSANAWKRILTPLDVLSAGASLVDSPGSGDHDFAESSPPLIVKCMSGSGHILSEREIETINTQLDRSEYVGATLVTVCDVDPAARTLAERINRKKHFELFGPSRLADAIFANASDALRDHLATLDGSEASSSIILGERDTLVLVRQRSGDAWFYILDANGESLLESDSYVIELRSAHPAFVEGKYGVPTDTTLQPAARAPFDRAAYLAATHETFRSLKYAAVAPAGYPFPQGDLLDVYVAPSAAAIVNVNADEDQKRRLLHDMLECIELDDAQRKQFESFVASRTNIQLAETAYAASLYQQHRNVAILGDPGSGKTCFIKRQILSYCHSEEDSWYRAHTPIYVSLAEAGPMVGEGVDLFDIASSLSVRRGLDISRSVLESLFGEGALAFFFDGLDEVRSLAQRASLMHSIEQLMIAGVRLGNRFVISSRPAAVHLVKLPEALRSLELRGLTDAEMRVLASKLVNVEFVRGGEKIRFSSSTKHGEQLVERLLEDCRSNPGIGRLARNPLLLTLLIMIYANTGAVAARRHHVYAQAVMTLVSVRNRKDGNFAHSEADLRRRLGCVALQAFESDAGPLTRGDAIIAVEAAILADGRAPNQGEAEEFLQSVAEATGLLVFARDGNASATVSFMHLSFLEYYAATGLLTRKTAKEIAALYDIARWRDILTLCAGIINDSGTVLPLVSELCDVGSEADGVLRERLLFGIDCALECDVPPDEVQRRICATTVEVMTRGPGRVDGGFRRELGARLGKLLVATGSQHVRRVLEDGIASTDPRAAAAFVDLAAHVAVHIEMTPEFVFGFDRVSRSEDPLVRIAVIGAAERTTQLRRPTAMALLKSAIASGSAGLQHAAARTILVNPEVVKEMRSDLAALVDNTRLSTASACARALLEHGFADWNSPDARALVARCLRAWEAFARFAPNATMNLERSGIDVRRLLSSTEMADRALGLRILPWLRDEEGFAYSSIMSEFGSGGNDRVLVPALNALRLSPPVRALLTTTDIDVILGLATDPQLPRDVRAAALRVLSTLTVTSVQFERLAAFARGASWVTEREIVGCLAEHASKSATAREAFFTMAEKELRRYGQGFGDIRRQQDARRILAACIRAGGLAPTSFVRLLMSWANNFKTPKEVRRYAILAACHVAAPDREMFARARDWISTMDHAYWPIVATGVVALVRQGRQTINWGRNLRPLLEELRSLLAARWQHLAAGVASGIDDKDCSDVRRALSDVNAHLCAMA